MNYFSVCPSPRFDGNNLAGRAEDAPDGLTSALHMQNRAAGTSSSWMPHQQITAKDIRAILKLRRDRDYFFDGAIFADPAWDMLLELYAAWLEQHRVSVSTLCRSAAVPASTALRWITMLEGKGVLDRMPDPFDGRRFYLSLSPSALDAMARYFKAAVGTSLI